jgi:hypothetical protein
MMKPPMAGISRNLIKYIIKKDKQFYIIASLNNIPKGMTMTPDIVLDT